MTRMQGSKDFWLASLRADGPAFREAIGAVALDAPVPPCPEWTVLDLVHHLGECYAGVRALVSGALTGAAAPSGPPPGSRPTGPDVLPWWDGEFAQLIEVLDALDPEAPAWNWAPQAKKAAFWHRRMAHETAVHRWDAQMAAGAVEPVEAKLAADGVSEVLDTWLPAGRRRGPTDRQGVVQLTAVDVGQDWHLRLRGTGVALLDTRTLLDPGAQGTLAAASGTASDLQLALFGRVPFDVLQVAGDASLLQALRTG